MRLRPLKGRVEAGLEVLRDRVQGYILGGLHNPARDMIYHRLWAPLQGRIRGHWFRIHCWLWGDRP